jgi:glycosyltransferase involved in cell wall biosynthesis
MISSSATSGAERHVSSLSQQLILRGNTVTVVSPVGGWLPQSLRAAQIPVIESNMKGYGWLRTMGSMIGFVRRNGVQAVHTHLTRAAYIGYALGRLTRIPVITSVHIANNDQIYRRLARGRNRLVAVSNYVAGMLHGNGIPKRYISTVYNGTDFIDLPVAERGEVLQELQIPEDRRVVGLVAKVHRSKGHLELIHAIRTVREAHPDVHVLFVGRVEESFEPELNDALDRSGIREHVTMTGVRHDVPRLLDAMTLSTMPSVIETFGVAAIEAMARRKAVVATRVGALPEVVRHQQTGLLVDLRPDQIADAISYLLRHEAEREAMGEMGRTVVRQKFTLSEMVNRFEDLYREVISAK